MATTGSHQQSAFTEPYNTQSPIDADQVTGNDNALRLVYNAHDADPTIHVQSSTLSSRPGFGTVGQVWLVTDQMKLYYDTGLAWDGLRMDASNLDTGTVPGARLSGSYTGITAVGTLTSLSVSGALTVSSGGANITGNSTITGTLGGITTLTATTLAGTLSTAAQPNVTSLGTLSSLAVSGTLAVNGRTYTFPATETPNYFLKTDGSGTLSWAVAGEVFGSGTSNYVTRWTASNTVGNSIIRDDGSNVGIGTAPNASYKLDVSGNVRASGTLTLNGQTYTFPASQTPNYFLKTNGSGTLSWVPGSSSSYGRIETNFTATAGQTSFSANYTPGYLDVYLNGVRLLGGTDYTATNGTSVVLTTGAALNDEVVVIAYDVMSISGGVTGSGTTNKLPKFTATQVLGDSIVTESAGALDIENEIYVGQDIPGGKYINVGATGTYAYVATASSFPLSLYSGGDLKFYINNAAKMTLDSSGRLGVGTASPSDAFHVVGNALATGSAGSYPRFISTVGAKSWELGYRSGTSQFEIREDGTSRVEISNGGNLGLGVTPSAWSTNIFRTLQVGTGVGSVSFSGRTDGGSDMVLGKNLYNVGGTFYYVANGVATMYRMDGGVHSWNTAASGTAGNAITFTQAMTLDASGNLGLGVNGTSFQWTNSGNNVAINATSGVLSFYTGTSSYTERASITSGGYFKASDTGTYASSTGSYHELRNSANEPAVNLGNTNGSFTGALLYGNTSKAASGTFNLISMNSNAVQQFAVTGDGVIYAQNTTVQSLSDVRLKENISDATDGLGVITALRPVRYDWKPGYGNDRKHQLGFIAQEVEAVFPEAVSEWSMDEPTGEVDEDGKPVTAKVDYKTVGPGALIPVLVKAIQELEARIAVLEAGA